MNKDTATNPAIRIFSSDLDGTLIGKPDATLAFRESWTRLRKSLGKDAPVLVYNSGRLLPHTLEAIRNTFLPEPDYIICGVGTLIYDFHTQSSIKTFSDTLRTGWDRDKVEEIMGRIPGAQPQPPKYQNEFKSSWYLHDAEEDQIHEIRRMMKASGLGVHVIYSSSRDLDVLPRYANKGNALLFLIDELNINLEETLVAGDTGNDSSMFDLDGVRGIVVENAQPELLLAASGKPVHFSERPFADGVLEGLLHFKVIDEIADVRYEKLSHNKFDPALQNVVQSESFKSLSPEQKDFIAQGYQQALVALRKNITPMGFSACSMSDNSFAHSDENYKSIWARDGAITVLHSLSVDEPAIRQAQKATLETLLSHCSETGQVPSNVRIDSGKADYSGVGNIASIDSGLWLVIACHQYVRSTGNYEFLRHWAPELDRIMNWLSAQDSNADSLLEIPEAGDWMDLFGRSYNVLYDEVLWYYANISHGRMAEILGDHESAGTRLRLAQKIKETINRKFWPSINSADPRSFSDQQYGMGDTQYLLAEITPFSYDWRCDVYGNILAGLFNVLSMERAHTAFNFMYGVGVNEPGPVVNLYPPVQSGDPHWRPYYTVNLLNLPHHYHNGGLWPFIGAHWVMFIGRLGLRDLAQQELYRLAEMNYRGISSPWEFNEWLHGTTGRPMGKRFQAWSAAGFIAACYELQLELEGS